MIRTRVMNVSGGLITISPIETRPDVVSLKIGPERPRHSKTVVLTRSDAISLARKLVQSLEELDQQLNA